MLSSQLIATLPKNIFQIAVPRLELGVECVAPKPGLKGICLSCWYTSYYAVCRIWEKSSLQCESQASFALSRSTGLGDRPEPH